MRCQRKSQMRAAGLCKATVAQLTMLFKYGGLCWKIFFFKHKTDNKFSKINPT